MMFLGKIYLQFYFTLESIKNHLHSRAQVNLVTEEETVKIQSRSEKTV